MPLSSQALQTLRSNLHRLPPHQKEELLDLVSELERRETIKRAKTSLLDFVQFVDPTYKVGAHHKRLASLLEDLANGVKHRVAVNIAPRFGKSHLVSYYFPAWFLGNHPDQKVMMVSHTADLAVDFGRKVRNLIASGPYQAVFGGKDGVELSQDSKSAGRWHTNHGGEYFAVGVGGAIAGRGADLLLIDDPHNEQDIINGNLDVFDKAYEWFTTGARTRLMPGGRVALVQCMTGDTPVLMASGDEKPLCEVRPGDMVASYDNGRLVQAKVLNWASNGLDRIFTIQMTSGITVRANERHPFLVQTSTGGIQWKKLKYLQPGEIVVKVAPVSGKDKFAPTMGAKPLCTPEESASGITRLSGGRLTAADVFRKKATGANGWGLRALQKIVQSLYSLRGCVKPTTTKSGTTQNSNPTTTPKKNGISTSCIGTAFRWINTKRYWCSKMVNALFANSPPVITTPGHIGITSCALIIVTKRTTSEGCSATTATLPLATPNLSAPRLPSPNISDFITDQIAAITPSGVAEVFDVQIERTENFIANGLVTHNTRWAMNDLTGRLVKDMVMNEGADQYEVVEFPAVLEVEEKDEEGHTQVVQKSLWPEQWPLEALLKTKASMPSYQWSAQYQQNPTSEEGAIVKREWWREWEDELPPRCEFIIQSWDTAFEKHTRADFSACTTWGVWYPEQEPNEPTTRGANIILLDSFKDRMEFPELKEVALKHYREWEATGTPVSLIVEKKASGAPLIYELRAMGIPAQEYTPSKGHDKISRLNSVADLFRSGMVWAPQTRWAEELADEVAAFPAGEHDDLVDATTLALMRFRQGGFVRLPSDEPEPTRYFKRRRAAGYY